MWCTAVCFMSIDLSTYELLVLVEAAVVALFVRIIFRKSY